MTTLRDILAHRGRIIVFTASAPIGLRVEQVAERNHAQVVCTRGWADIYGPLHQWNRIHVAREYGLLSCDQHTYFGGIKIPGTDYVWIGNCFDHPEQLARYNRAGEMSMYYQARMWTISEDAL